MKIVTKNLLYGAICLLVAIIGVGPELYHHHHRQRTDQIEVATTNRHQQKRSAAQSATSQMRTPINWRKSSETKPYPNLAKAKHLWIKVSLKGNRTYIYDGKKLLYTMYSSGGVYTKKDKHGHVKSMTPTGTFYVQAERGDQFFNQSLGEGANYYVSWLDHGTYLFHSVPTKANGSYNRKEAAKLGKSTGSHGCIRLSVADARWLSQHLPEGTKVKIVDE